MSVKNFLKNWIPISLCLCFCATLDSATWNQDADANWNVDANWTSPALFPDASGATAIFPNNITAPRDITLGQDITIGSATFSDADSYTIQGAHTLTFDVATGNATITSTRGNHTISSAVELNDPLIVTQNGGGGTNFTISGAISGTNSLRKRGNGILTLNNASNSYRDTIIEGGTLSISSDGALGQADGSITFLGTSTLAPTSSITSIRDVVLGEGVVGRLALSGDFICNGVISGSGDISISSTSGTFIPTNVANDYTGSTILVGGGGGLEISDPHQLGNTSQLNVIGGNRSILKTIEDMTIGVPIVFTGSRNGGLFLSAEEGTTVNYSGNISSNLATGTPLVQIRGGEGVVQLTGNNLNFSNGIEIINDSNFRPTLEIFTLENLGSFPSVRNAGGVLKLSGNIALPKDFVISSAGMDRPTIVAAPGTHSEIQGVIQKSPTSGSSPVLQIESNFDPMLGGGILNLSNPGNLFQWGLSISHYATVQIQQDGNLGLDIVDNFVELDNGSLEILPGSGIHSLNRPLTLLNGNGSLILHDGTTNGWGGPLQGSGTLTLTKPLSDIGNAILQLSGKSSEYTGNLVVNDITLQISSNDNLGSGSNLSLNGATLEILPGSGVHSFNQSLTLLNGNGSLILHDGTTNRWGGALQGSGTLTLTKPLSDIGNAILQLSGKSSEYTGNLVVNDITLQISSNDNLGSGSNLSLNGATLEFLSGATIPDSRSLTLTNSPIFLVDNGVATIEGMIGGTGSLTKTGFGILTLSGNNTYPGLTAVQAGELRLNGQVAGDVLVSLGSLISGTGTVGGTLTVNGGIAPGNSIGTLNVIGNYVQNAGSIYFLEINDLGQSDLINITGSATLNGGQVVVTSPTGTALVDTPYTILAATEGVSGGFEGVSATNFSTINLLIIPTLVYDANHAYLLFAKTVFNFDAVTPNQIAVATQLESLADPTPEEFLILKTLAALSATEQQHALDEMSGVQYASLNLASEIASRQFIRRLYDPLRSIVTTEPCNGCCCECLPCSTFDLWLEAGGGQTFIGGNSHAHGLKLNGWKMTGGVQTRVNLDWTIGIAGSYIEDCMKHDLGGSGKNRLGFGAIYGLYRPSNFYVLVDLAFGSGNFSLTRPIDIGALSYSAKGRPKHYHAMGYMEAGVDRHIGRFLIQPFVGFECGYFNRHSFFESGMSPLNLSVNKQTYGNAFSRLGMHLTTEQWSSLKLSVDVAWDCRLTSHKGSITESFQFGTPFTIEGTPRNRNSIDVAATVITELCGGWELYAEADAEFWSKVSTYTVLGGVKSSW